MTVYRTEGEFYVQCLKDIRDITSDPVRKAYANAILNEMKKYPTIHGGDILTKQAFEVMKSLVRSPGSCNDPRTFWRFASMTQKFPVLLQPYIKMLDEKYAGVQIPSHVWTYIGTFLGIPIPLTLT